MEIKLSKEDADIIADAVVRKLTTMSVQKASTAKPDPMQDPANWVRATDLDKHINISTCTLNRYVEKGKIGRAKLTGCTYYYLPDIGQLLKDHYYKADAIEGIMKAVKGERRAG